MAGCSSPKTPELKARLRVVCGDKIAFGPGKAELLARLQETGSLNEAARQLDMSYMRAWTLVKTMNKCFREPVVAAERGGKHGGGMKLTKTGQQVLELYQQMEQAAMTATGLAWRRLRGLLRD